MLKIKKLTVQYGPLPALNEISLEVNKGETVSLLGPNGAGKTTLLLTLSGILKTTEGRILFEEEDITNLSPHQIVSKGVGHVPQGRHIFPTLSVIDNLMMGAYPHRNDKKEIKKDLERIYQLLPVLHLDLAELGQVVCLGCVERAVEEYGANLSLADETSGFFRLAVSHAVSRVVKVSLCELGRRLVSSGPRQCESLLGDVLVGIMNEQRLRHVHRRVQDVAVP
jgi:ABC-type lipopolysaccharide export system ATPase subunit